VHLSLARVTTDHANKPCITATKHTHFCVLKKTCARITTYIILEDVIATVCHAPQCLKFMTATASTMTTTICNQPASKCRLNFQLSSAIVAMPAVKYMYAYPKCLSGCCPSSTFTPSTVTQATPHAAHDNQHTRPSSPAAA